MFLGKPAIISFLVGNLVFFPGLLLRHSFVTLGFHHGLIIVNGPRHGAAQNSSSKMEEDAKEETVSKNSKELPLVDERGGEEQKETGEAFLESIGGFY